MKTKVSIVAFAVATRVLAIFIALLASFLLEDYDLSQPNGRPFVRWDAVYFMEIARNGYRLERQLAFFPGFALLVRLVDPLLRGNSEEALLFTGKGLI